jgi:hypothetical protein
MNGTKQSNNGLGAPGGILRINVPKEPPMVYGTFGDETPQTLEAHTPPQPLNSPIPTKNGVTGIAVDPSRRRTVGPIKIPGGKKTRRNTTSGGDIVTHLLTIRNQIKLYHWQTREFARHTATDALTLALDTNIDAFVESYMGRYGRPKVRGSIKLHNFSESAAKAFVAKETKYLERELPRTIGKGDTDLLNLRDTILGDLTKVLYLFTLQ